APSGWVQTLLADENLLIVAASAGAVVFLLASSVVVIVVCAARRRRLKGHLNPHGLNGLNGGHRPLDGSNGGLNGGLAAGFNGPMVSTQAFQRFSGTTNSTISSVHSRDGGGSGRQKSASFALINQLPILDERSMRNGRCTALSIGEMDYHHGTNHRKLISGGLGVNIYTPQKSPLISTSMSQCVQLCQPGADGESPLLCPSDGYRSDDMPSDDDECESPTPMSSSPDGLREGDDEREDSPAHHFYERPHHYSTQPKHDNRIHYNIPPPRPAPPPPDLLVYHEPQPLVAVRHGTNPRLRHYSYSQTPATTRVDNFDYDYDYQIR
ncbi:unnamed protein product, partial [Medioppia subpectinata]